MEYKIKVLIEVCKMLEKHLKRVEKRVKNPERKAQIHKRIEGFRHSREELAFSNHRNS